MQKRCNKQTPDQKKLQDEQPGIFFLRFYLFIFMERGGEGEKYRCVVASRTPSTEDLACNPG